MIDWPEPFVLRALAAGLGLAIVAAPLGCVIVWRRMAYVGETLAQASLLGVALGIALQINLTLAVVLAAVAAAGNRLQRKWFATETKQGLHVLDRFQRDVVCIVFEPFVVRVRCP